MDWRQFNFDQRALSGQGSTKTATRMTNPSIMIASHEERAMDPTAVLALYAAVNWPWVNRQPTFLTTILATAPALGAWDETRLVGFARAVTDGHFRAYIEDVAVHPDYQRQGIGRRLIAALLTQLVHIDTISLFCQAELAPFYTDLGFRQRGNQLVLHCAAPQ